MPKTIISCYKCGKKMRVPTDKHIRLNCVNCREAIEVKAGLIYTPVTIIKDSNTKDQESFNPQSNAFGEKINIVVSSIIEKIKNFFESNKDQVFKGKQQFFIKKSAKKWAIISSVILAILSFSIGSAIVGNYAGDITENIFKLVLIVAFAKLFITFDNKKIIIAEVFENHLNIARDVPVGATIANIFFMYKMFNDKLDRIDIPFRYIKTVTCNTGFFSDGVIMINGIDEKGQSFSFPSALSSLDDDDLKKLQVILHEKGIKM